MSGKVQVQMVKGPASRAPTAKIFRQIIFLKGSPTFTFLGLYNSYFGAVCAFEAQKTLTTEKIDIWIWEKLEINHKTFK